MQTSLGLKSDAAKFQECVAVAVYTRSLVSDNANFIIQAASMVSFRLHITSLVPTYTNCFMYHELDVVWELCSCKIMFVHKNLQATLYMLQQTASS
jgi:hypothetical protein